MAEVETNGIEGESTSLRVVLCRTRILEDAGTVYTRSKDTERERESCVCVCMCIYIYIYVRISAGMLMIDLEFDHSWQMYIQYSSRSPNSEVLKHLTRKGGILCGVI